MSLVPPVTTVNPVENAICGKNNPSGASVAIAPISVPVVADPSYTVTAPPFVLRDIPTNTPAALLTVVVFAALILINEFPSISWANV